MLSIWAYINNVNWSTASSLVRRPFMGTLELINVEISIILVQLLRICIIYRFKLLILVVFCIAFRASIRPHAHKGRGTLRPVAVSSPQRRSPVCRLRTIPPSLKNTHTQARSWDHLQKNVQRTIVITVMISIIQSRQILFLLQPILFLSSSIIFAVFIALPLKSFSSRPPMLFSSRTRFILVPQPLSSFPS